MKKFESVEELLAAAANVKSNAQSAREEAHKRWANCAKPLGSLGVLETNLEDIAALTGSAEMDLSRRMLLVFCADNGVIAQGVAQAGPEITTVIGDALASGCGNVSQMARVANCQVVTVDMGILNYEPEKKGMLNRRMGNGTADFTKGPAMTTEQAEAAHSGGCGTGAGAGGKGG